MKLVRIGSPGQEIPGLIDGEGRIRDLRGVIDDVAGEHLTRAGLDKLRALDVATLPIIDGAPRYGAAVGRIGKFICVGLNYADHAAESGMEVPKMPILFMKATTAVCGPNDTVIIPRGSVKSDWEVELGVVIGDVARDVSVEQALDHVAGYAVINDLSEREFQLEHGGQWVKGKSADTFGPIGPWLVTRDEIPDPQNLSMWLEVNGHRYLERQHPHDGVRRGRAGQSHQPLHDVDAGRCDQYRYAAGCRAGPEAACLPEAGRRDGTGDRRAGPAAPGRGRPPARRPLTRLAARRSGERAAKVACIVAGVR